MSALPDLIEEAAGVALDRVLPFWLRNFIVILGFGASARYWDSLPPVVIDLVVGGWGALALHVVTGAGVLRCYSLRHALLLPGLPLAAALYIRWWDHEPLLELSRSFVFSIAMITVDGLVALVRKPTPQREALLAMRGAVRIVAFIVMMVVWCVVYDSKERAQMWNDGGHPFLAVQVCIVALAAGVVPSWVRAAIDPRQ